ncbi:porin [Burkholderia stabilis]|uniref:Porin n=1 Tax=Burkholderia stabilis TaxID=95485 RepID=A0A4Q2A5G0_9BURK|nr:porin [Burkholderia stabilis]RXV64413.1 porin [Burkholderia stabilis]
MRVNSRDFFGATLMLAAGHATAAEASVTLYGVTDVFIQYLDNGGTRSIPGRSGGSAGSQLGMTGASDLGGGLKAKFVFESGFNINNGTLLIDTASIFYRQAWVGLLDAKYGTLTFGRQYTPSFRVTYPTDPFRLNEALSPISASLLSVDRDTLSTQYSNGRASNSILYQSPNLRGVQLYGMYAFSATVTQPTQATIGNELNLGASYSGHGFYAGLSYANQHSGQASIAGLPGPLSRLRTEHYVGAFAYQVGIVKLQFNYAYARPKDAPAGSLAAQLGTAHSSSNAQLGATIQATPVDTIAIAIWNRNVRGAHDNAPGVQIGIDHALSKRTSVYAGAGYIKNNGSSTTSWSGIPVSEPGTKQVLAAVGMAHRF